MLIAHVVGLALVTHYVLALEFGKKPFLTTNT